MIEGIIITPLKQIVDERGKIMHMLRRDSNVFKSFGEIYFSTVNPKFIKAWHKHKEATLNYACIQGKVKFVLFDDRKGSKTFGKIQEIYLSPDNYFYFNSGGTATTGQISGGGYNTASGPVTLKAIGPQ